MDFIEKIFGVSPDGDDGLTEVMFIVAIVAIAVLGIAFVRARRSRAKSIPR
jgi:hypothetical protein